MREKVLHPLTNRFDQIAKELRRPLDDVHEAIASIGENVEEFLAGNANGFAGCQEQVLRRIQKFAREDRTDDFDLRDDHHFTEIENPVDRGLNAVDRSSDGLFQILRDRLDSGDGCLNNTINRSVDARPQFRESDQQPVDENLQSRSKSLDGCDNEFLQAADDPNGYVLGKGQHFADKFFGFVEYRLDRANQFVVPALDGILEPVPNLLVPLLLRFLWSVAFRFLPSNAFFFACLLFLFAGVFFSLADGVVRFFLLRLNFGVDLVLMGSVAIFHFRVERVECLLAFL